MKRREIMASGLLTALGLVTACRAAGDDYRGLLRRLPDSTTALVLVDVNGLRQALGVARGTTLQTAEISAVPVAASKFVLGAHIDLAQRQHVWSVALVQTDGKLTIQSLAKAENEPVQDVGGHPAVVSSRHAYFVELAPNLLAISSPPDRKILARWLKFQDTNQLDTLPAYLINTANSARPVLMLMAVDLEDSTDTASIRRGLTRSQVLSARENTDYDAVARFIARAKGVRLAVRPGSPLAGELTVDFDADTATVRDFAKPLLLEILQHTGLYLPDFDDWAARVTDRSVSIGGPLSVNALRKLGMLIQTPAPNPPAGNPDAGQPPAPAAKALAASQQYFQSVTRILEDLKNDKDKTLDSRAGWYEHAATQLNSLPTLDVVPELAGFGTATAERLQSMATGMRDTETQITYVRYNSHYTYFGWEYGSPQAGYTPTRKLVGALQERAAETRRQLWDQIDDATAKIREHLTQKFNTQF
jgi:hypothetical protein